MAACPHCDRSRPRPRRWPDRADVLAVAVAAVILEILRHYGVL